MAMRLATRTVSCLVAMGYAPGATTTEAGFPRLESPVGATRPDTPNKMGNVLQTQPNPQLTEGNPVVASLMIRYIVGGSLPEHLTVMCFAALPSVGHTVMVPVVLTMSDQPPVWYSGRVGEVRWTWHQHYESMIPELILDTVFAWLDDDPDRGPLPVCARCRKQPLGERGCSSYEGDHPKKPNLESNVCYPCGVEVASLTKKKPESPL